MNAIPEDAMGTGDVVELRERMVRIEVQAEHRAEKLDALTALVQSHSDESRAWRAKHDDRHAAIESVLTRIQEQTARVAAQGAEDTGSVLVEGATAAGKGIGAALSALPAPVWYVLAAAILGAMGLGTQVGPLVTAATTAAMVPPADPAPVEAPEPPPEFAP